MKKSAIKIALISFAITFSLNAHSSVYDECILDANLVEKIAGEKGNEAAQEQKQKTTVEQCFAELNKIEAKYKDKIKGRNPYSVMNSDDRVKWAKLFEAIDTKQFKGVRFLQASYYGEH